MLKVGEKLIQMGKRKSKRLSEEEMGKRQPYGFGLGRAHQLFAHLVSMFFIIMRAFGREKGQL